MADFITLNGYNVKDKYVRDKIPYLEWYVNVKEYGAKGDGITDDIQAFNNALASMVEGGVLYIPSGTYVISETLNIPSNITMLGGENAEIIVDSAFDGTMIEITNGTSNVELNNIIFNGNCQNLTGTVANEFVCNKLRIIKCEFKNYNEFNPIQVHSSNDVLIDSNYVHDVIFGDCIAVSGCTKANIINNVCMNYDDTAIVSASGSHDVIIANNFIDREIDYSSSAHQSIAVADSWEVVVSNNIINERSQSDFGIRVRKDDNTQGYAHDVLISNNIVYNARWSVLLENTYNVIVEGNKLNNGGTGIALTQCDNINIINNEIIESGLGTHMYGSSIKNISLSNNIYLNKTIIPSRFVLVQLTGDNIEASGNRIEDNKFIGTPSENEVVRIIGTNQRNFECLNNQGFNRTSYQDSTPPSIPTTSGGTVNHDFSYPFVIYAHQGANVYFWVNGKRMGNQAEVYPNDTLAISFTTIPTAFQVLPR